MNNLDDTKISTNIVIKLFEMLKDSIETNTTGMGRLSELINEMVSFLKNEPKRIDIKQFFDDYLHKVEDKIDENNRKINEIKTTCMDSKGILKTLKGKITTMIVIVIVTFSLMTVSYLFVKSSVDVVIDKKVDVINSNNEELMKQLEEINKKINNINGD